MQSFNEFYSKYPNLVFVKTKIPVIEQSQLVDENFIIEEDTPPMEKGFSIVMPFYKDEFPNVFKQATAMEAGLYAIDICEKTGVEISRESIGYILKKVEANISQEDR